MAGRLNSPKLIQSSNSWLETELWLFYNSVLDLLEAGLCEKASQKMQNDPLAISKATHDALNLLISARIALKNSHLDPSSLWIFLDIREIPWIKAEADFVLGLAYFHTQSYEKGIACFTQAESKFLDCSMHARSLLSAFNALVGQSYLGQIIENHIVMTRYLELEKKALLLMELAPSELTRIQRVLAMIYRQKATAFEHANHFHAALAETLKAIPLFETVGPRSDYQLALLMAAEYSLIINNRSQALTYFEYILPPVDSRVELAYAYLQFKLYKKEFTLEHFEVQPAYWKDKISQLKSTNINSVAKIEIQRNEFLWSVSSEVFLNKKTRQKWHFKANTLEGKLLTLLMKTKMSKFLLAETLWPELASISSLDHRLHQLISRINSKYGGLIQFNGKDYSLQASIEKK